MEKLKDILGCILLGFTCISFVAYLLYPIIFSQSENVISITISIYILNKISLYYTIALSRSSLFLKLIYYLPFLFRKPALILFNFSSNNIRFIYTFANKMSYKLGLVGLFILLCIKSY